MAYDDMDDESSPSQAGGAFEGNTDEKSDETEDQLALVPTSFFQKKGEIKPGMRETVEVVSVYENEVSIKCVYEEEPEEEPEMEAEAPVAPPEDAMMT